MRSLFSYFLIFLWLVIGQQKLLASAAAEVFFERDTAIHEHGHSLMTALAMVVTGDIEHSHDHDHDHEDEFPWDGASSHSSKSHTHSHFEGSHVTAEFLNPKAIFSFPPGKSSEFSSLESNVFGVEMCSNIFRPPIQAQFFAAKFHTKRFS